jgi:hypothetical protein
MTQIQKWFLKNNLLYLESCNDVCRRDTFYKNYLYRSRSTQMVTLSLMKFPCENSGTKICHSRNQYCTRLTTHPNAQILTLMEIPGNGRLRRHVPNDPPNRILL